ncbi:hypothetical protein JCM6882_005219 [Rhodosporidiobolus microsporus]
MLARSHGLRLDHNQENPALHSHSQHHTLPTKTPARAGKSAAPVTGGKGVLTTAKTGRVLGAKDRNQGKRDANEPTGLLFPGKPSTSQAGPSQQFKTPAPSKTLRPLQDMCTPATGVRPKHAPQLMLATPSPDVSMEVDEHEPVEEEEIDREVEYAGGSARDYDEPFIPDHPEPDYRTAGFGDALRGLSLGGMEQYSEWDERDAVERGGVKIVLDDDVSKPSSLAHSPSSQPLFPVPSARRAPLSAKLSNCGLSTPNVPSASRTRPQSALSGSATLSSRKPLTSASSSTAPPSARRPLASSSSTSMKPPSSTSHRPLAPSSSTGLRSTPSSSRPTSSLASSKISLSSGASSLSKPSAAPTSTSRPSSAASLTRPRPAALSLSRPSSAASVRSASASGAKSALSPPVQSAFEASKAQREQEERDLGVFGVTDEGVEDALLDFGGEAEMEAAEAFRLDLEL